MTSRERVLAAVAHEDVDRIPIDLAGFLGDSIELKAYERLKDHLGLDGAEGEKIDATGTVVRPDRRLLSRFGADVHGLVPKPGRAWTFHLDPGSDSFYNEWGIRLRRSPTSTYYEMVEHPLAHADARAIESYPLPDPRDPHRIDHMRRELEQINREAQRVVLLHAPRGGGVFEKALFLRGPEEFFLDLALQPDVAVLLVDRLVEFQIAFFDSTLRELGDLVDIVQIGDDFGSQDGMMISPRMFREFFKEREARIIETIKGRSPHVKIFFHSCGSVAPIIPDLIEIGVDILNPVQITARGMDSETLKRKFGRNLTFWGGGCDTQQVLPYGKPEDVAREVERRLRDFSPGGGYVFAPVLTVPENTPPENLVVMYDTALHFLA